MGNKIRTDSGAISGATPAGAALTSAVAYSPTAQGTAVSPAALLDELVAGVAGLAVGTDATRSQIATAVVLKIAGEEVEKAAEDSIAFSAADTINTGTAAGQFWGIWLYQIDRAGVVTTKSPSADQVHASEAAAITALPAADAGKVGVGRLTVQTVANLAFTADVHELDATTPVAANNWVDFGVTDLVQVQLDAASALCNVNRTRSEEHKLQIDNLKARLDEVEARLQAYGLIA